ncbi:Tol biopolymer transport system component/imidazolonepropionase-like amidohydrolase [Rhodopirellula rubra]|uniref:Tol biopolymer transport system component/imidazolonepropionase-like amidohydrolase n=1 Tax=Aporhodopirellula rubra TaxID=980271 RepID=A0A7W5E1P8_9BACT|nr:amidohydrolase family protein [Aporhodopirellula rubra]MBB3208550.1 Tol biopolymer transport system component/imidazolonepropionase-like amidohydrolase [Aporhodopirellula rubra]
MRLFDSGRFRLSITFLLLFGSGITNTPASDSNPQADAKVAKDAVAEETPEQWDIESPPGPVQRQEIDCDSGTWMNLDVSPDGESIVFDLLGDLYVMPISGADGTKATNKRFPENLTQSMSWDMQPRFSPDGKHIAFTSDRTGKSKKAGDNVWIVTIDGTSLTQVTNETYRLLSSPAWSPDGQYLVARKHFSSRRSLGAGECHRYHRDAIAMDATAGTALTTRSSDQKDVNEPAYSPDGRYLYYSQDVTPGKDFEYDKNSHQGIYAIKRLDLVDGDTETLIRGPGGACRPTPSPDGKTIAFVRRVGVKTGLHLFDLESGRIRLVYDDLERDMQEAWAIHGVYSGFDWTPDGKSIVVWAKGKIRRIDIDSGTADVIPFRIRDHRDVRKAVRHPIPVGGDEFDVKMLQSVQVSPDGTQVVYQALGHLYLKTLPDGVPTRLTEQSDHFEFSPSFSKDGRYIVYTTWNDRQLGSIRITTTDPDRGERWIVSNKPGHYMHPSFSPDGKHIVYEQRGGGHIRSALWSRDPGIYMTAIQNGEPKLICEQGTQPRFDASGERVFVTRRDAAKDSDNVTLVSVDLHGNQTREHYKSDWATDFAVSPDGKSIALIERFHVYVAPFVHSPTPIQVGPNAKGIPTVKVSDEAGEFIHFSGDSQQLHWSLGPNLYTCNVADAMRPEAETDDADTPTSTPEKATSLSIGFTQPTAKPDTRRALVGARILTMGPAGIIKDGVILIDQDRIVAVGPRKEIEIPDGYVTTNVRGQVIMPGLIDAHAHGAQATFGITPQHNWIDYARIAFGVTTIHDPSNDTHAIFAASELAKAGMITSPRTFSTGKILYGATGAIKAEIDSLDDARFHLRRMKAVGAFTVKSYNQPRRDQRQQVIAAARELDMMVVPEGGSTFMHNMTMIVDGHTGIEHTLPVQTAYDDVMDLWRNTGVGYTPTLSVAYGGLSGERYWYQLDDLWLHTRLQTFIPPHVLNPRSRRREKASEDDYNHMRVAEIARDVVNQGGMVQAGGHGQLPGVCTHWEMWSFVQGGMTPMQALECGTLNGAKYLGLDRDLGSVENGKLADLIVFRKKADPTKQIRDSEKIALVIAGGNVFQADRMNRYGDNAPRADFYWQRDGGVSSDSEYCDVVGCSCHRGRQ